MIEGRNKDVAEFHHAQDCDVEKTLKVIRGLAQFPAPDVLHFIGHGLTHMRHADNTMTSVPLLISTASAGGGSQSMAEPYNQRGLTFTLNHAIKIDNKPRLVVLQACETAAYAKFLVSVSPTLIVVAWVTKLLDSVCHIFSAKFYDTLFSILHKKRRITIADVHDAFAFTRIQLQGSVRAQQRAARV